jgi:hypothetical protein
MGDGLLGLWQHLERRLLRQDIQDYPTLYYKVDQMSREKYTFMNYAYIEILFTDLSRHGID